ncbi:MAG TPA: SDR family oxidoreductase [Ilumatobacteraceae bacterium]|nr:SDR family oxidoreductase [Ilumatobacteraceae bacterium]
MVNGKKDHSPVQHPGSPGQTPRGGGIDQVLHSASIIAAERMVDGGTIINISSPAGDRGVPGSGHYATAKAGVNSLTKTLSLELAPSVRVNGISSGYVPTEVMMIALDADEAQLEQMATKRIPLRRSSWQRDSEHRRSSDQG